MKGVCSRLKSFGSLFYLEISSVVFAFVVDLDPFERVDLFCGNIQARNNALFRIPYTADKKFVPFSQAEHRSVGEQYTPCQIRVVCLTGRRRPQIFYITQFTVNTGRLKSA